MSYKLNSIYLLQPNNAEPVRLLSYYYEGFGFGVNELFNTNDEERDRYAEIITDDVPLIKKNQITKYTRELKSFYIFATVAAWDKNQKEKIYFDSYSTAVDLYIAPQDIESITTREETRESNEEKGKRETVLYYDVKLKKNIATVRPACLWLFKTWEDIPEYLQHHAHDLAQKLEENRATWAEIGKNHIAPIYEERIAQGFKFSAFGYDKPQKTAHIEGCAGVQRVEKTPEYKRIEKIRDILNSCCYSSNKLSMREVLKMCDKLNITIKRKVAK